MPILKGEVPVKGGYFGYKARYLLQVTGVAYGREDIDPPHGKGVGFRVSDPWSWNRRSRCDGEGTSNGLHP